MRPDRLRSVRRVGSNKNIPLPAVRNSGIMGNQGSRIYLKQADISDNESFYLVVQMLHVGTDSYFFDSLYDNRGNLGYILHGFIDQP